MSLPSFVYGPGPAPGYGRPTLEGLELGSPHHQGRHFSHEHPPGSGPSSPAMASPAHLYNVPPPHLQHLPPHSHGQPFAAPPPPGMLPRMGVFHEAGPVAVGERATRGGRRGSTRKQGASQRGAVAIQASLEAPLAARAAVPPTAGRKAASRDSKRRATHSQIERRRREKINDRLITLRNLVPACAREVEERKRKAAGLDIDGTPLEASIGEDGKRKRIRRKNVQPPKEDPNGDEELGLHKLEVLTHAIDYIYELQARIEELQTGTRPALLRRASDADRDRDRAAAAAAAALEGTATPAPQGQEEDEEEELEMDDWKGTSGGQLQTKIQGHHEPPTAPTWDPRPPPPATSQGRFSTSSGSGLTARPVSSPSPPSSVLPLKADPMVSSFRSSRRSSPSVMSLTADSPMLSPFASALLAHNGLTMPSPLTVPSAAPGSSGSAFTQLTSPVMSMGAESPIFKAGGASTAAGDVAAAAAAAASCSAGPSGSARRASILGKQTWSMLPSSALPLPSPGNAPGPSATRKRDLPLPPGAEDAKRVKREAQDSTPEAGSSSGAPSSASAQAPPARSDAELLLSFSTSPEALRPLSAVRESFFIGGAPPATTSKAGRRPTVQGEGSSRATASGGDDGQSRGGSLEPAAGPEQATSGPPSKPTDAAEESKDKGITQSAPGGAWATAPSGSLNSPPHLALDGSASASGSSRGGDGKAENSDDGESGARSEREAAEAVPGEAEEAAA